MPKEEIFKLQIQDTEILLPHLSSFPEITQIYQPYLQLALTQILDALPENLTSPTKALHYHEPPAQTEGYLPDLTLFDGVEKLDIATNARLFVKSEFLSELGNYFNRFLNDQILTLINKDLTRYRAKEKIFPRNTSAKQAVMKLETYLKGVPTKNIDFTTYFFDQYESLNDLLKTWSLNFSNSVIEATRRINLDMLLLKEAFLSTLDKETVYLQKIIPTSSDLHREGRQVFILAFADSHKKTKKVVYKPLLFRYCKIATPKISMPIMVILNI